MKDRTWATTGGWALVVAGIVGAGAAVALILIPPAVAPDRFSFPFTETGFVIIQSAFFVHHLLVVWGLLAFWRCGYAGRGALAMTGGLAATASLGALAVQELVSISAAGAAYPSATTNMIEAVYGMISLASGVGLLLLGVATARARVLPGIDRFIPLLLGIFVFVPLTPAIFGPFVLARLAIGTWLLLFAWLGVAMVRHAKSALPAADSTVADDYLTRR
jgi:hypothetical protein